MNLTANPLDPTVAAVATQLVQDDEQIAHLTRQLVAASLKETLRIINHGTPEQKVSVTRGFMPVLAKALAGTDQEDAADAVNRQTREIIGACLTTIEVQNTNVDADDEDDEDDEED